MEQELQSTIRLANGETFACSQFNPTGEKTLVLVHGNLTDRTCWNVLIKELLAKYPTYRIFSYDQRGYGESSYESRIQRIEDFSNDLAGILEQAKLPHVTLIGWSLGGIVSMQLAADHPELLERLVIIAGCHAEGFPLLMTDEETKQERRVRTLEETIALPKIAHLNDIVEKRDAKRMAELFKFVLLNGPFQEPADSPEVLHFVSGSMKQRNYLDAVLAINLFDMTAQGTNSIARIACPALFFHGEKDLVVPKEAAIFNAERVKECGVPCELIVKEAVSHCPPYDCPEELAQEIIRFTNI